MVAGGGTVYFYLNHSMLLLNKVLYTMNTQFSVYN